MRHKATNPNSPFGGSIPKKFNLDHSALKIASSSFSNRKNFAGETRGTPELGRSIEQST